MKQFISTLFVWAFIQFQSGYEALHFLEGLPLPERGTAILYQLPPPFPQTASRRTFEVKYWTDRNLGFTMDWNE